VSLKKTTFLVVPLEQGWIVKTESVPNNLGPYSDKEHALMAAFAFAREKRPSQVKVQKRDGAWRVAQSFE